MFTDPSTRVEKRDLYDLMHKESLRVQPLVKQWVFEECMFGKKYNIIKI
jgi:hypothetical protein